MGVRGLSSYVSGCQRACSEHVELNVGADDDDPANTGAAAANVSPQVCGTGSSCFQSPRPCRVWLRSEVLPPSPRLSAQIE